MRRVGGDAQAVAAAGHAERRDIELGALEQRALGERHRRIVVPGGTIITSPWFTRSMESLFDAVMVNLSSLALNHSHTFGQSAIFAWSTSVSPANFASSPRMLAMAACTKAWPEPPLDGSLKANCPGLASSQAVNSAQPAAASAPFRIVEEAGLVAVDRHQIAARGIAFLRRRELRVELVGIRYDAHQRPVEALASSSDFSSTPPTSSASIVPVVLEASATTLPMLAARSPATTSP